MVRLLTTLYDSRETRVDPVTLVALFQQGRFSGIADYQPADMDFRRSVHSHFERIRMYTHGLLATSPHGGV